VERFSSYRGVTDNTVQRVGSGFILSPLWGFGDFSISVTRRSRTGLYSVAPLGLFSVSDWGFIVLTVGGAAFTKIGWSRFISFKGEDTW